jgi:ABC transport system ATP-binding/permease protein
MNESMLRSMLQILAGFASISSDSSSKLAIKHVEGYIVRNFGNKLVAEKLLEFNRFYHESKNWNDKLSFLEKTCLEINKEFSVKHKFLLIINIFNFYSFTERDALAYLQPNDDSLGLVAGWLKLDINDFLNYKYFKLGQLHLMPQKDNIIIAAEQNPGISTIRHFNWEGVNGYMLFLHIPSANIVTFLYNGTSALELSGKPIYTKHTYIFSNGLVISGRGLTPIYHSQVLSAIHQVKTIENVTLTANNICYSYLNSDKGIKNLSFTGSSGELVGIMGGSGVGKSTLLKLLSGNLSPQKGEILINGHNIINLKDTLKNIVGIMHQEECLVDELTVFENLYIGARMVLGNLSSQEVKKLVENKLYELDLTECTNNRVGSPLNRQLSGGERKRLAIALELVRDPRILFVDEPTSGLSSADSEVVMNILKNIALSGRLVIVNIHQPSSDIFKLFDKLIILDKGGIPIFTGNPIEAILHFKGVANLVDKTAGGCEYCGNIKPELIFNLVEERNIDELGQKTAQRKLTPEDWYSFYQKRKSTTPPQIQVYSIPETLHSVSSSLKQFNYYFRRNVMTKIRNREFIFLSLVLPPILAVLISLFLRSSSEHGPYSLYLNPNLASFFFMCILASLFFGLILSCEDILRDRQLIVREKFIGLSLKSFYNAKLLFLIILSAYQTLCFAFLGTQIIGIIGFTFHFWIILFLVSIVGNITGLIISSALRSVVAIYILVPFLLIPQILFSGLVVNFDDLNPKIVTSKKVPVIGEIMITRWASEAILVQFYSSNKYNKHFFQFDFEESALRFRLAYLLPELFKITDRIKNETEKENAYDLLTLRKGMVLLAYNQSIILPESIGNGDTSDIGQWAYSFLEKAQVALSSKLSKLRSKRDSYIKNVFLSQSDGTQQLKNLKYNYHNKALDNLMRSKHSPKPIVIVETDFIQKIDPIFLISGSNFGRSHFFAPVKKFFSLHIYTFWFNAMALILIGLFLYGVYIFNIPSVIVSYIATKKIQLYP